MNTTVHPDARIGHVHLKVSDLERAIAFYTEALGFEVTQRMGDRAAFLSAGGYHHHLGLNTWESLGGAPPPLGSTGLFHAAILYPDRTALAEALVWLDRAGVALDGAGRSRGERGALPARPRRQRAGTLLGPTGSRMAPHRKGRTGHGHASAGSGGVAATGPS